MKSYGWFLIGYFSALAATFVLRSIRGTDPVTWTAWLAVAIGMACAAAIVGRASTRRPPR